MATPAVHKVQAASTARESEEPVLGAGDRLSREEFEWRYQRTPAVKKAELIESTVYMPSPAR